MSMAGAGAAATVGGGLIQGVSSLFGSDQTSTADTEKAQAARYNAAIARRNASMALDATGADVDQQQRQNQAQLGQIRSAYGASGLDMTGSALDVLTNVARQQTYATQNTAYKGRVKAQQYGDQANIADQDAAIYDEQASAAGSTGILGAIGSVFGIGAGLTGNRLTRNAIGFG